MKVSIISTPRRIGTALAVAVLALVVAGCSGSASTNGQVPTTPAPSSSSASATASVPGTGVAASASPTASATPTLQVHLAKKGEPPVVMASGFTYTDSGSDLDMAAAMAAGINKSSSTRGMATGSSTHLVESDSGNGFMVLRISLSSKSRVVSDSQWNQFLRPGVAEFAGARSAKVVTVGGEKMAYAAGTSDGEKMIAYGWIHGRVLTIIIAVGPNTPATQAAEAKRLVSAYVAAQK